MHGQARPPKKKRARTAWRQTRTCVRARAPSGRLSTAPPRVPAILNPRRAVYHAESRTRDARVTRDAKEAFSGPSDSAVLQPSGGACARHTPRHTARSTPPT